MIYLHGISKEQDPEARATGTVLVPAPDILGEPGISIGWWPVVSLSYHPDFKLQTSTFLSGNSVCLCLHVYSIRIFLTRCGSFQIRERRPACDQRSTIISNSSLGKLVKLQGSLQYPLHLFFRRTEARISDESSGEKSGRTADVQPVLTQKCAEFQLAVLFHAYFFLL